MIKINFFIINDLPILTRILIAVLVCSGVFYVGNKVDIKKLRDKLETAQQQEGTLKNEIKLVIDQEGQINSEISKFLVYSELLNKWENKLAISSNVDNLFNQILKSGADKGLRIIFFDPEPAKKEGIYFKVVIKIIALGNYNQIGNFMSQLANMSSIIAIRDFSITTKKKNTLITSKDKLAEQMVNPDQLQLETVIDVYYLPEKNK
jgi:type IV pilus assembly protein PilO